MEIEPFIVFVLASSIILQFLATGLALRLIPVSGGRTAWILIAVAIMLMAFRRSLTFYRLITGDLARRPDSTAELIALAISILLVIGIARIAPLFQSIRRSEADLADAKRLLEKQNSDLMQLDRIKDGLMRDVSHELKTPIAKHAIQLELIRSIAARHRLAGEFEKPLAIMENAILRQGHTVRNILELSRLQEGGRTYRREPVRLDHLLEKVIDDYRPIIEEAGGAVRADLPPATVRGDEEMLWHVFSNLINNAVKFRRRGSPGEVRLAIVENDREVLVEISDDGIGLTPLEKGRVFEKFYQAAASIEGCGLGLAICKDIVESHGGRIWLESRGKDQGATASVVFPRA